MICVAFKIGKRARKRMNICSLVGNKSLLLHIDITTLEEHFFWRPELRVDDVQTFVEVFFEGALTLLESPHLLPLNLLITKLLLLIFFFDLTDFIHTFLFIVLYSILWFTFRPPHFILHFCEFLVVLLLDNHQFFRKIILHLNNLLGKLMHLFSLLLKSFVFLIGLGPPELV